MSSTKIITGASCPKCQGKVELLSRANGIVGERLDPKTIGECIVCTESIVYDGNLEAELLGNEPLTSNIDKSEVKTEAIKSDERPSPYHILNVVRHLKYFDWYGLIDCIRATGIILDQRIEHIIKKLMVNNRGHKNYLLDLKEARWTLDLVIEKEELRLKNEQK